MVIRPETLLVGILFCVFAWEFASVGDPAQLKTKAKTIA
jgi:hypothetical protein